MTFLDSKEGFRRASSTESYTHPKTIDEYIKRYQIQVDYGYDSFGMCQGLIDLLNELKEFRAKNLRVL